MRAVAQRARELVDRQVVAERVRHLRVQQRLLLVAIRRVHHVHVDGVRHPRPEVEEVVQVHDDPAPHLLLERHVEPVVDLRPQLVLVEAHRAAEVRVTAIRLAVRLDHRVHVGRIRVGQQLLRHPGGQPQRVRRLGEARILGHEVAQRVAHVADRHLVPRIRAAHYRVLAHPVVHAHPRHEVLPRAVPRMRVVVTGKHPGAVVRVAVALARHQRQRLRVHRRRGALHLGDRRRQVEPLRQPVLRIRRPRLVLPPQPQVHRQPVVDPVVVLHVRRVPHEVRRLQRHQAGRRLAVERAQHERRPLVARVHHVGTVRRVGRQRRVEHQVDRLEARRLAVVRPRLCAPLQVVRALVPVHPHRRRPRIRVLIPLAPLPSQPVRRRRARPRRHVQRRVIHVAAVVERAVPLVVAPVVCQPLGAQQQRRVVELVGHVVVAAPHVQRRPVRDDPHRIARQAHPVAVAARQREEPRV